MTLNNPYRLFNIPFNPCEICQDNTNKIERDFFMDITTKCRLLANPKIAYNLNKTMILYSQICNFISDYVFNNLEKCEKQNFNYKKLQNKIYNKTRKNFPMASSQIIIRAFADVCTSYKSQKSNLENKNYKIEKQNEWLLKQNKELKPLKTISKCEFKKTSAVSYDTRLLSIKIDKLGFYIASIWTINGRIKKIPLHLSEKQKRLFKKLKMQGKLVYRNKKFLLNLPYEVKVPKMKKVKEYIGVDMGQVNVAVDSDGVFYEERVKNLFNKIEKVRKLKRRLQECGTKSAKKHLKKLNNAERIIKKEINHIISRMLINKAKGTSKGIIIEDLKRIMEETVAFKNFNKSIKEKLYKWAFAELGGFINYKGLMEGIEVCKKNARNTSIKCNECGHIDKGNRNSQSNFKCLKCGHIANADLNAARNISEPIEIKSTNYEGKRKN